MEKKKSSIKNKVVSLVFAISFTALLLTSLVAAISVQNIVKENDRVTLVMGNTAASASREALERITCEELEALVVSKKNQIEILFDGFGRELNTLSGVISGMYSSSDITEDESVTANDETLYEYDSECVYISSGVAVSDVYDEIVMLSDIVGNLRRTMQTEDSLAREFYIGTESGIFMTTGGSDCGTYTTDFDARASEWYTSAKEKNGFVVTGIGDEGYIRGGTLFCSAPVYDDGGKFVGVVGMRVNIDGFLDSLDSSGSDKTDYIVVSTDRKVVFANDAWREKNRNLDSFLSDKRNDNLNKEIFGDESGSEYIDLDSSQIFVSHTHIKDMNWIVVAYVVLDETLAPSVQIRDGILELAESSVIEIKRHSLYLLIMIFGISIIILLMAFICGHAFARRITDPLKKLTDRVKEVDGEKTKFDWNIDTDDEISDLADAFGNMTEELEKNILKIKADSKEREKRHAEYNIAKQIQMSVLPTNFREFSNAMEFEVSATIQPAKGVGGDFYDYFKIDKDHIAIVIADVSGKGVPAALFMMISKILIDTRTKPGITTGDILSEVNSQLCINNDVGMFVTAFLGILDIRTGKLQYSNAGHTPPLLYRYKKGFSWLNVTKNLFLAGMEDTEYATDEIQLTPGDMILLYTDGVTEAKNKDNNQFTKEKLLDVVNSFSAEHMTLDEIIASIKEEIDIFVGSEPQNDDITMLIARYYS